MTGRPIRIQLSRRKGWRMPANTVKVDRSTKWGNPFNFKSADYGWVALSFGCRGDAAGRHQASVVAFRQWIDNPKGRTLETDFGIVLEGPAGKLPIGARARAGLSPDHADIKAQLGGRNLACWCPLDRPCHADVLLEIANR